VLARMTTPGRVLVVNAGSTSTKLALVDGDEIVWSSASDSPPRDALLAEAADGRFDGVAVVGHRVVHGGAHFDRAAVVDEEVVAAIEAVADLAPLHNQAGLAGIAAARDLLGESVVHVAVFDTMFHRTLSPAARAYGGPRAWLEAGLYRYGFHGISHQWASERAALLLDRPVEDIRLVTCHLGGGSSVTAVARGRSVDTTMGLTPLDGLVMATRAGSVDPGLLLYLLRRGTSVDDLDDLLERRSGLLGLSGESSDLRAVVAARDGGSEHARLAVDVFVRRVAAAIGSMIAALDGLDAIVFTGGIGEHSPEVRARAVAPFHWVGAAIDDALNRTAPATDDTRVSPDGADVQVLVVVAREAIPIAHAARLAGSAAV